MSEWVTCTLKDIVKFGNGKTRPKTEGNIPIYGGNGILGYSAESNYQDETIIIGRVGAYCGATYYEDNPIWVSDNALSAKANDGYLPKYVYYVLKHKNLNKYAQGSSHPLLTQSLLNTLDAYVTTDHDTQQIIARIISTLEDKIELNRQTKQTLENIAQAIFKSWFVDFEPTRAKIFAIQNGQDPERAAMAAISGKSVEELNQLSPEQQQSLKTTAALFPDTLVDSELGEVPDGWSAGKLDSLCDLNISSWTRKNPPTKILYVDLANTKNGVIEGVQFYSWDDAPSRAKRILKEGDTIIGTVRPGNRSFSLIGETQEQLTASTGFAVLSPKKTEYIEFLYIAAVSDENIDRLAHLADGGAYPAVRPDIVTSMELAIPPDLVIYRFSKLLNVLFKKRNSNFTAEKILKELRDTLLPKLLSGELNTNKKDAA